MPYILSLDQGTSSSRAIVVDEKGVIVSLAQKEVKQIFPESGWVEQDGLEIFATQLAVAKEALVKAGSPSLAAIGISNQRETTMIWERKSGRPIHPAIVWQDRRTASLCQSMKAHESTIQKKTGLTLDPYFSATKIKWILEHVSGSRKMAEAGELAFGTIDTWLIWQLTQGKVHATDTTNASRTLLFNIQTLKWDDELLKLFDIPLSLLPEVKSSSEIYGETTAFGKPVPIAGVAGDQQAALFGQGCFREGMVKATYGTGCFILMNTGQKPIFSSHHLLTTIGIHIRKEVHYALEGSIFIAGAAIQWLRDNLKIIQKSAEIDPLASSVPDTGGVFFVPAFTGLGAPHWDPHARGILLGLSRGTTNAHIARAVLESIAFQATDVLCAMSLDSKIPISELRVDGGVVVSDLVMQLQADLTRSPVLRPKMKELTALGAAYLAGLGTGVWQELSEISSLWELDCKFTPMHDLRSKLIKWNRAIERAKGWAE